MNSLASESFLISRIEANSENLRSEAIQLVCLTQKCKITSLKNGAFVAKNEVSRKEAHRFFQQAKAALSQALNPDGGESPNNLVELSYEKKTVSLHGFNPAILAVETNLRAKLNP
jgi:hypothetical protein